MTPQALADRQHIQDVLVSYCHALDERDWPGFHALFTADARLDSAPLAAPQAARPNSRTTSLARSPPCAAASTPSPPPGSIWMAMRPAHAPPRR